MILVSSRQIRAARALLDWSQLELADKSLVSLNSVIRLEQGNTARTDTYAKICTALEKAGIVFISAGNGQGEGVRLAGLAPHSSKPRRKPAK